MQVGFSPQGPRRIAEKERRGRPVSQQHDAVSFEITHLPEIHAHTFRKNAARRPNSKETSHLRLDRLPLLFPLRTSATPCGEYYPPSIVLPPRPCSGWLPRILEFRETPKNSY